MKVTESAIEELLKSHKAFQRMQDIDSKIHSKRLDKILGYKIPKIEVKLLQKYRAFYKAKDMTNRKTHYQDTQTWIGLHPQVLQTPYNDLYEVLSLIPKDNIFKIVDIGCAYGRIGVIASVLYPKARFIGYEILDKRVNEANRIYEKLNLINSEVIQSNVLDFGFELPDAQIYFIYDFSEKEDIKRVLSKICEKIGQVDFYLITRGERVESLLKKEFKSFFLKTRLVQGSELAIYKSSRKLPC